MDNPTSILIAIRDLVAAAEEAGWDTTENRDVLEEGREAYGALRSFLADDLDAETMAAL